MDSLVSEPRYTSHSHLSVEERNEAGVPTCPFDHHDEAFGANFTDYLDEMRAAGPLVWSTLAETVTDYVKFLKFDHADRRIPKPWWDFHAKYTRPSDG